MNSLVKMNLAGIGQVMFVITHQAGMMHTPGIIVTLEKRFGK